MQLLRHGPMSSQIRVASTLVPAPFKSGPTGTLPHSLGVQLYVTASSQDELVQIDNDGDGLFSEDPQNLVNDDEDMVWNAVYLVDEDEEESLNRIVGSGKK